MVTSLLAYSQDSKEITWSDLVLKIEFDDPFTKLSSEQLFNLGQVAKIREKEEAPGVGVSEYDRTKKDSLEHLLAAEDVDVDGLLAKRYEIAALRQKQFESVDTTLNNVKIIMAGYLLPLNFVEGKTTEFLLVPWVGACIHTPPPPKNQIIYLQSKEGIEPLSRFQAVSIEGFLTTNQRTSTLYLVDGTDDITSGYSMFEAEINLL